MTFTLNAAMLQPIVALLAGILILIIPRNLELHYRYLPDIRGRDGVVASSSIRPSALKGGTAGSHQWRSIIWLPGDNMLVLVTGQKLPAN